MSEEGGRAGGGERGREGGREGGRKGHTFMCESTEGEEGGMGEEEGAAPRALGQNGEDAAEDCAVNKGGYRWVSK